MSCLLSSTRNKLIRNQLKTKLQILGFSSNPIRMKITKIENRVRLVRARTTRILLILRHHKFSKISSLKQQESSILRQTGLHLSMICQCWFQEASTLLTFLINTSNCTEEHSTTKSSTKTSKKFFNCQSKSFSKCCWLFNLTNP